MTLRRPETMLHLVNKYTGVRNGWGIITLSSKSVDLPQMPVITVGTLIDKLSDSESAQQQLDDLKIKKAKNRRSLGIQKEVIISASERHRVTVEQGQPSPDSQESQEVSVFYEYTNGSWHTGIIVSNRDLYSLRRYATPYEINVSHVDEESEVPKNGFNYNFDMDGVLNSVSGTIPDEGMYVAKLEHVHGKLNPLATFILGVDIRRRNIKPMETLESLLKNINSERPVDPISLLVFEDKEMT